MAVRPGGEAILRGIQRSLATLVLPEVKGQYAVAQIQYALLLLNALAGEWDGAAQRLVDENTALRSALALAADGVHDLALAAELRAGASSVDADVRVSTLTAANDRLHGLVVRALAPDSGLLVGPRAAILATLRDLALARLPTAIGA